MTGDRREPLALAGPGAAGLRHPMAQLLLALTFMTGLIDAVSYLGLGQVFTANMTGNVVLLGFGLAGSGGLPVVAPIVSLVAFVSGAALGGRLVRSAGGRRPRHVYDTFGGEVVVLAMATIVVAVVDVRAGTVAGGVIIALLAVAMGIRNATARSLGVPDLTTTVLTLTLTGLGADSRVAGSSSTGTPRRLAAAGAMLLGAASGALLLEAGLTFTLGVCTAGTAIVVAGYTKRFAGTTGRQGPDQIGGIEDRAVPSRSHDSA